MLHNIFIGTYSEVDGLYECTFDDEAGTFDIKGQKNLKKPSYIYRHKDTLFGVSETDCFNETNGGGVFSIDIVDGWLSEIVSMCGTNGKSPCHLCVHDSNIYVSNYTEGSLSVFDTNGRIISPSWKAVSHYGHSINQSRQEKAHVHFSGFTPDNRYLAVCDLGLDKVFFYPYSSKEGLSLNARVIDCPPGSGPRHLTFSPNGDYVYILTELSNEILTYEYKDGIIGFVGAVSSLPTGFNGESYASAIKTSVCGNYLCVSNRGHDSIAIFDIGNGAMPLFERTILTDSYPRDFCFSLDGRWIIVANQKGDSVSAFLFDGSNAATAKSIKIPKPVCVIF